MDRYSTAQSKWAVCLGVPYVEPRACPDGSSLAGKSLLGRTNPRRNACLLPRRLASGFVDHSDIDRAPCIKRGGTLGLTRTRLRRPWMIVLLAPQPIVMAMTLGPGSG